MASIKHLVDIDLNKNQLTNVSLQHLSGNPGGTGEDFEGRLFYDSANGSKVVKYHNGTEFLALSTNEGDVTGVGAGTGLTGTDLNGPVPTLNVIGGTGITANADNVAITAGGVGTTQLANDGVTADKLANSINSAIAANTAKNTNVSTNLSVANSTGSRVIASSDGTNATIPVATTSVSGVMSTTIFNAVTANTAKNTNVSTNLSITGSTGARTIASSDGNNAIIPVATTSVSGVMSPTIFDAVTANTAKVTNTDTNVSVGTLETRLSQINSNITIGNASTVNTTISGDLIVNGDTTTITSTIVAIGDNMMKMAKDNSS